MPGGLVKRFVSVSGFSRWEFRIGEKDVGRLIYAFSIHAEQTYHKIQLYCQFIKCQPAYRQNYRISLDYNRALSRLWLTRRRQECFCVKMVTHYSYLG